MQIDWPRYVKTAKEQGLTGIEVVRLIQKKRTAKLTFLRSSGAWPEQNLQRLALKPIPLTSST